MKILQIIPAPSDHYIVWKQEGEPGGHFTQVAICLALLELPDGSTVISPVGSDSEGILEPAFDSGNYVGYVPASELPDGVATEP